MCLISGYKRKSIRFVWCINLVQSDVFSHYMNSFVIYNWFDLLRVLSWRYSRVESWLSFYRNTSNFFTLHRNDCYCELNKLHLFVGLLNICSCLVVLPYQTKIFCIKTFGGDKHFVIWTKQKVYLQIYTFENGLTLETSWEISK